MSQNMNLTDFEQSTVDNITFMSASPMDKLEISLKNGIVVVLNVPRETSRQFIQNVKENA